MLDLFLLPADAKGFFWTPYVPHCMLPGLPVPCFVELVTAAYRTPVLLSAAPAFSLLAM
jgi:hypothetical protein